MTHDNSELVAEPGTPSRSRAALRFRPRPGLVAGITAVAVAASSLQLVEAASDPAGDNPAQNALTDRQFHPKAGEFQDGTGRASRLAAREVLDEVRKADAASGMAAALNRAAAQRKAAALAKTQAQAKARAKAAARKKAAALKAAEATRKAAVARVSRAAKVSTSFSLPVAGYRLTGRFGQGGGRWADTHTGLDFACPAGTAIRAVAAGTVVSAGWSGAYGWRTVIRHALGIETWYAHQSSFAVRGGQVRAGQVIGRVGSTGNSTGPHVHLEVRVDGRPVDPASWLRRLGLFA